MLKLLTVCLNLQLSAPTTGQQIQCERWALYDVEYSHVFVSHPQKMKPRNSTKCFTSVLKHPMWQIWIISYVIGRPSLRLTASRDLQTVLCLHTWLQLFVLSKIKKKQKQKYAEVNKDKKNKSYKIFFTSHWMVHSYSSYPPYKVVWLTPWWFLCPPSDIFCCKGTMNSILNT